MPTISVIVPVYKVEKYLRRCLDCLAAQTFPDWEAICVNDGSPDGCRAIIGQYASRDSRYRLVDKENGGLSDARNAGLAAAHGEFVVYLDSDDFIHPQTLELSLGLARKYGTDIVSWYKDPNYRNLTILRHKLGLDTIDYRPRGFRRRYSLDKVKCCVTDDIFSHVTENSHPKGIDWPIKHFYVWRHLIRRELLSGVEFLKGITFEDFPWWSELLLKNPSVTITYLPFYYYYPNFGSIDLGSSRLKKMRNWCTGLEYAAALYRERAGSRQAALWSRNCKWPVIQCHIAKRLDRFNPQDPECADMLSSLGKMWDDGVFDDALTSKDICSRAAVARFIGK